MLNQNALERVVAAVLTLILAIGAVALLFGWQSVWHTAAGILAGGFGVAALVLGLPAAKARFGGAGNDVPAKDTATNCLLMGCACAGLASYMLATWPDPLRTPGFLVIPSVSAGFFILGFGLRIIARRRSGK